MSDFTPEEDQFIKDQFLVTGDWPLDDVHRAKHDALARMLRQAHMWGREKARAERVQD